MAKKKTGMLASLKKADVVPNLITSQQYARLKHDPKLVKAAVDIVIAGQQLDTDSSAAVEELSRKPTMKNAARLQRVTVVAGLGLPAQASRSGAARRGDGSPARDFEEMPVRVALIGSRTRA